MTYNVFGETLSLTQSINHNRNLGEAPGRVSEISGNFTVPEKWSTSICFCDRSLVFVVCGSDSQKSQNGRYNRGKIDETSERQIKRLQSTSNTSRALLLA